MEINIGDRVTVDDGKPFILGQRVVAEEQPQRNLMDSCGQAEIQMYDSQLPTYEEIIGALREPEQISDILFKENTLKAINESLAEKFKTVRPLRAEGELTFWDKWLLAVYFARTAKPASN